MGTSQPLSLPRWRGLRWPKFFVLLFFSSVCAAKALPVARVLGRLVDAPLVFHPEPLLVPTLGLIATAILLVWLLLDVGFDLLLPRGAVASLVLLAALPWGARPRSEAEELAHLRQAAREVAEAITRGWERGESLTQIREAARGVPAVYRGRTLRKLPFDIAFLPPGVSLPEEESLRPATFHVSISEEGGWLTASRWTESGARLLRSGSDIEVFRISSPGERELAHGF